jgi:hypothetical protein
MEAITVEELSAVPLQARAGLNEIVGSGVDAVLVTV